MGRCPLSWSNRIPSIGIVLKSDVFERTAWAGEIRPMKGTMSTVLKFASCKSFRIASRLNRQRAAVKIGLPRITPTITNAVVSIRFRGLGDDMRNDVSYPVTLLDARISMF
jgi:hypothetical protein